MKMIFSVISILTLFVSCTKTIESDVATQSYDIVDSKGTSLNITDSKWYTTRDGRFGDVHLRVSGYTNGDKVTILTHGDGLVDDYEVKLDPQKRFDEDVIITFTAAASKGEFWDETDIKVYSGKDTLVVNLQSGTLRY